MNRNVTRKSPLIQIGNAHFVGGNLPTLIRNGTFLSTTMNNALSAQEWVMNKLPVEVLEEYEAEEAQRCEHGCLPAEPCEDCEEGR